MQYIFPDTNIFIHGKHFEEIDWKTWLCTDEFTLVVTAVVIAELDKHKYNPIKKVSKRARMLLPKLEAVLENPSCSRLKILPLLKKSSTHIIEGYGLDNKEQDDILLATILEFKRTINDIDSVTLITNDSGPRLKALSYAILTKKLPEEYMQSPEPDEAEKKIAALEKEVLEFKTRIPDVILRHFNGKTNLVVESRPMIKSKAEFIKQQMDKIWAEYPPMTQKQTNKDGSPPVFPTSFAFFEVQPHQIEKYNQELKRFYEEYETFLSLAYENLVYKHHCIDISIVLYNNGTVPANDLDIQMHFPDGFDIVDEADFPKVKRKPTAPHRPKNSMDIYFPNLGIDLFRPIQPQVNLEALKKINSNVSSPQIKKTNSYDVEFNVQSIKHNQSVELDTLFLKFENIHTAKGFNIDYRIFAANIPKVIEGSLNVKFEIRRTD